MSEKDITDIFNCFQSANPAPQTELVALNPFTMLVSVVLSAQATDKSINKATQALYEVADTPAKMASFEVESLIGYIRSIGLYRSKASHIIGLSEMLSSLYGPEAGGGRGFTEPQQGSFPRTREEFLKLPGVGRKTANVMLNILYHEPTMPVDTHLLRLSPRMGLSDGTTPKKVEKDLLSRIPPHFLEHAHHWLILHGRYVCTARNPHCTDCIISVFCCKNGIED